MFEVFQTFGASFSVSTPSSHGTGQSQKAWNGFSAVTHQHPGNFWLCAVGNCFATILSMTVPSRRWRLLASKLIPQLVSLCWSHTHALPTSSASLGSEASWGSESPEGLIKIQISGPSCQIGRFSRSEVGPGNVHLSQVPRWCECCWPQSHLPRTTVCHGFVACTAVPSEKASFAVIGERTPIPNCAHLSAWSLAATFGFR